MTDPYQRLPIYQDNQPRRQFNIGGGHDSVFHDMRRRLDDSWGSDPFSHTRTYKVRPFGMGLDEEFDNLCKDFFELKQRNPLVSCVRDSGSRESLDEDKVIQPADSQGQGRKFQMSFDVKDYEPQDISVKVDKDTLVVEAKREGEKDGVKSSKQFSRNVHLPKDVDPDKLVSSLSNDGILTLSAPVPPNYQSVAYVDPKQAQQPITYSTYAQVPSVDSQATSSVPGPQYIATSSYQPPSSYPSYQQQPVSSATMSSAAKSNKYDMPPPPAYQSPRADPPPQPNYPAPPPPLPKTNSSSNNTELAPSPPAAAAAAVVSESAIPVETPTFTNTGQGRRLDLIIELGSPYTSDDILVKLEGRTLQVEAEHIEKIGARKSKSCVSREFDLDEEIDPRTVQANFDDNGRLIIVAMVAPLSAPENGNQS